jgi:succinate dehydrogenase / fumarate reductase cytochrome b subunit
MTDTLRAPGIATAPPVVREPSSRRTPWPVAFYRSAVGKKWVMAVSGVVLMLFIVGHLIGNLKLYLGRGEINLYGEALRTMPGHLLPRTVLLWVIRVGYISAFVVHIHAAWGTWRLSRRARGRYQSPRDWLAANYASRTMRYTGIIVLAYLIFHLVDLTWTGSGQPFVRGDPYNNLIFSLQRPVVAAVYIIANVALGVHLMHGAWSLFQSLGINNPRINLARRRFAQVFAAVIVVGNVSFPVAVQLHLVEPTCSANRTPKTTEACPASTVPVPGHGSAQVRQGGR